MMADDPETSDRPGAVAVERQHAIREALAKTRRASWTTGPARPAVGKFPFPHRTVAEVWASEPGDAA